MNESKKKQEVMTEYRECVENIAESVAERNREDYQSELEPFEAYAKRVQSQLHLDMDAFRERLYRGYSSLLEGLREMEED